MLTGMMLLLCCRIFGQGLISVSNFTGTASVVVPLYNVTQGSVSVPVTASYNAGGLKVKDVEGNAGMGWNVNAGGGVYRTVRGLPDDVKKDNAGNNRLGWLYNTQISAISGFGIQNTSLPPNCTYEANDISYITGHFNPMYDTEPDTYSVSAPGLSCQLVFDASGTARVQSYNDIKVSYVADATTGNITSFTITNGQGTVYKFADRDMETRSLLTSSPSSVSFFNREYSQYHNGISYANDWRLTSITDINENEVFFEYGAIAFSRNTPFKLALGGSSTATAQFTIGETFSGVCLSGILTGNADDLLNPVLDFFYSNYTRVGSILSHIDGYGNTAAFKYAGARNMTDTGSYYRQFLSNLSFMDKSYDFKYHGVSQGSSGPVVALPDSSTQKIDYWGYYNGSSATSLIPQVYINPSDTTLERYRNMDPGSVHSSAFAYSISGADRSVNVGHLRTGSLDTITYAHGGFTTLLYEPHSYYDPTAVANLQGGGLRIKQVRDYTGTDTAAIAVRTYDYVQPGTSTSSGKPISLPIFEFTTPYSGSGTTSSKWANSTVRSENDLSPEDKTIIYSAVKVSQDGAGSTLYEYTTPATFWDSSYSTDWQPTKTYIARTNCAVSTFATSDKYTYAFAPNANYDFERGLLTQATSRNSGNDIVSQTAYTYQRNGTPTIITGLKVAGNGSDTTYAKYNIYTNVDEQTTAVTSKVYNLGSTSVYKQNTVEYYYNSAYHKLMTQEKTTNSDGSIARTNIKYVKDYIATGTLDSASNAIYQLQQLNCNIPVETYMQVERSGTNRTVAASLTRFNKFSPPFYLPKYLPQHKMKFVAGAGVTDFAVSGISSGIFTSDSRYVTVENDLIYDYMGNLQTADDNNRHVNTTLIDAVLGVPQASFSNVSANEIAYGSFSTYYTVNKNPHAGYYVFSVKLQAAAAGTFTVTLTGTATHNYTFSYAASAVDVYYRLNIPLTDMGSSFTVAYSSSTSTTKTAALFYPNIAQATSYAYDAVTRLKKSETNTNGKSAYYDYDGYNRPLHIYDNDKQMVRALSYVRRNGMDGDDMGTGSITPSTAGGYTVYLSGGFSNLTNTTGAVYTWNFGDGSAPVTTTAPLGGVAHTYAVLDSFKVTLTVSSPYYNTKSVSHKISSNGGDNGGGGAGWHDLILTTDSLANGSAVIAGVLIYDSATKLLLRSFNPAQLAWGAQKIDVPDTGIDIAVAVRGQGYDPGTALGYNSVRLDITGPPAGTCAAYAGKSGNYRFSVGTASVSAIHIAISTDTCTPAQ